MGNRKISGGMTGIIIDAAMKVHSALGAGLLESAYQAALAHELRKRGLHVEEQVAVPVRYDGIELDVGYRMDMLVENEVVVELKAVTQLHPVHEAQLLSNLRLSGHEVALLLNFHVLHLKDGITRKVNRYSP